MSESHEDTVALRPEKLAESTGEAEEADEAGAPEKFAEAEDEHPLESPDALRHPRDETARHD